MKTPAAACISMALALAAAARAEAQSAQKKGPKSWTGYNQGVRWEGSLDEAKARAAREGKPVLFYQLVGDLDKEGC
jgi:hypothetical protein